MTIEYYEAVTSDDYYIALQRRINDGSIWSFEGSAGRAAMAAIQDGFCVLGKEARRDYYGSLIPSRYDVVRGTKGSAAYAREQHGDTWARRIARVQ